MMDCERSLASLLLDGDHAPVGVSDFGDDVHDWCEVCGFAVGPTNDQHDTAASLTEVATWVARLAAS